MLNRSMFIFTLWQTFNICESFYRAVLPLYVYINPDLPTDFQLEPKYRIFYKIIKHVCTYNRLYTSWQLRPKIFGNNITIQWLLNNYTHTYTQCKYKLWVNLAQQFNCCKQNIIRNNNDDLLNIFIVVVWLFGLVGWLIVAAAHWQGQMSIYAAFAAWYLDIKRNETIATVQLDNSNNKQNKAAAMNSRCVQTDIKTDDW